MKWKMMFILLLLVMLLVACGLEKKEDVEGRDGHIETSIEQSEISDIEIETEIGEYTTYKYSVHFPRTENADINAAIQSFITEKRQEFLDTTEDDALEENEFSELNIDFEISYITEPYLSVVFTSTVHTPESESNSTTYTLNFNRSTGTLITLGELLNSENSIIYLQQLLNRQVTQNEQLTQLLTAGTLTDGLSSELENYENFSLGEQSLNIYFNSNQFQNAEIEPFQIALNYNNLTGIIDAEFLKSLYQVAVTETEILSESVNITEANSLEALDPNAKYVALTFDDGPHQDYTPVILDTLQKYNARATFYVLGKLASSYPDLVKRAYDEGHEIGSHTWSHQNLTTLSTEAYLEDINATSSEIAKITGEAPATIRPPYGAYNDNLQLHLNTPIVLWSVDTLDWKHRNPEKIKQIIQSYTTNGSIILMHDIQQSTAEALEDVLINLTSQGYQFVTVSELLQLTDPAVAYAGQVYTNQLTQQEF